MKYDKKIKTLVGKIKLECDEYLNYTSQLNECAFTDRKIEVIISNSKTLENYHYKRFENIDKNTKSKER